MAYFPFYVELEGKKGVIVGGGRTALHKVLRLKPFGAELTVIAKEIDEKLLEDHSVCCLKEPFSFERLADADFVIAATDDKTLNHRIFEYCMEKRILVNSVDDKDSCGFIFPALVKRGPLTIGISTGGASPTTALTLKNQIEELIPDNIEEILHFLDETRPRVRAAYAEEKMRAACFKELYRRCMVLGRPLSAEELDALMEKAI